MPCMERGSNPGTNDDEARARALLARWQNASDVDALDELLRSEVDALARRLRARAGGMISGSMSASDLAQEAVLRMLRLEEAPAFDDPRALRAYLWTSAWRLLVNRLQSPGREIVRLSNTESQSLSGVFGTTGGIGALERDEQRTALEVVVNLLKPEDRESLGLVYFEGLSIDEAARKAGISRGALDTRLMRARARLAERLVDWADIVG
jgi:RNA polymerase sigma factor (sigma-70 family)